MWGIDASIILILIPIVVVGIILVSALGAREEKTRGDRIARFFSIASNAAIFFTVLALLFQVTASEREAKRASYAEVLDTYAEINLLQVEHPDVWRLMYPDAPEFEVLSEDDRLALQYTYFTFNFFERLYLFHREGVIDDERWKRWQVWIEYSMTTSPLFQQVWHESRGLHHTDFVAYIEAAYDGGACLAGSNGRRTAGAPAATP